MSPGGEDDGAAAVGDGDGGSVAVGAADLGGLTGPPVGLMAATFGLKAAMFAKRDWNEGAPSEPTGGGAADDVDAVEVVDVDDAGGEAGEEEGGEGCDADADDGPSELMPYEEEDIVACNVLLRSWINLK